MPRKVHGRKASSTVTFMCMANVVLEEDLEALDPDHYPQPVMSSLYEIMLQLHNHSFFPPPHSDQA